MNIYPIHTEKDYNVALKRVEQKGDRLLKPTL